VFESRLGQEFKTWPGIQDLARNSRLGQEFKTWPGIQDLARNKIGSETTKDQDTARNRHQTVHQLLDTAAKSLHILSILKSPDKHDSASVRQMTESLLFHVNLY
jgi:hypothetical protein